MMVYLHHKSVCYERMMEEYIKAPDCHLKVRHDVEAYLRCDDSVFYEHLRRDSAHNAWPSAFSFARTIRWRSKCTNQRAIPPAGRGGELKAKLKARNIPSRSQLGPGLIQLRKSPT